MAREKIDWDSVETEYRIGIKSLRAIGDKYGCSEGAIRKKAREKSWIRDLSEEVRTKAQEIVREEEVRLSKVESNKESTQPTKVRKKVRKTDFEGPKEVRRRTTTEKERVEASAEIHASIDLEHRSDIKRAREIAVKLFLELQGMVDQDGMAFSGKVGSLKTLSDTLKTIIETERKIYKLDVEKTGLERIEDVIGRLDASR